jgi:hypothetical protein
MGINRVIIKSVRRDASEIKFLRYGPQKREVGPRESIAVFGVLVLAYRSFFKRRYGALTYRHLVLPAQSFIRRRGHFLLFIVVVLTIAFSKMAHFVPSSGPPNSIPIVEPLCTYLNLDVDNPFVMPDCASPCSPDRKTSGIRHPQSELCSPYKKRTT